MSSFFSVFLHGQTDTQTHTHTRTLKQNPFRSPQLTRAGNYQKKLNVNSNVLISVQNVQSPLSMLTYKGDLNLCLKYVTSEQLNARRQATSAGRPSTSASSGDVRGGELLVLVKQARNLTAVRSNGFSDPFCKWSAHCISLTRNTFYGTCICPMLNVVFHTPLSKYLSIIVMTLN